MTSVGTCEAETHLTELLERVAKGERIVITSGGKAVAMLVPPDPSEQVDSAEIGRSLLAYRDLTKRRLGGHSKNLAHEGHRY